MTKEQVGDLPALGSPVGHAHHRAFVVCLWDSSAQSAIDKDVWQDARHAWNMSNANTAGKPHPRRRYSQATANGKGVVYPRTRGNPDACSMVISKPL